MLKKFVILFKKTFAPMGKKAIIELDDIAYKFFPVLATTFLVSLGVLSLEFLFITIGFCSALSNSLHDAIETYPKMKEHVINLRTLVEGGEPKFEWRYLWQLLTGTGRFAEPKKD